MDYLVALIPSLGVGFLLFLVLRAVIGADRKEREAQRKFEEELAARSAETVVRE